MEDTLQDALMVHVILSYPPWSIAIKGSPLSDPFQVQQFH